MNNDWLTQLAPESAPASPGWWPLAPGWWALAILIVIAAGLTLLWLQRPAARRQRFVRSELQRLRERAIEPASAARGIQNLLRRYALTVFGHDATARLSGEAWLQFVIDSGGDAFAGDSGRTLLAAAFGDTHAPISEADRLGWFDAADQFLRRAHPQRRAAR
ncbi:DUF4381 domain-containing protein [Povalibacter sp.]|uniref:DUF4381 domain-containing protein n=1 Tax=Povalibacter sp. TaxID=1962978 RepID=UPI002F3FF1F4